MRHVEPRLPPILWNEVDEGVGSSAIYRVEEFDGSGADRTNPDPEFVRDVHDGVEQVLISYTYVGVVVN